MRAVSYAPGGLPWRLSGAGRAGLVGEKRAPHRRRHGRHRELQAGESRIAGRDRGPVTGKVTDNLNVEVTGSLTEAKFSPARPGPAVDDGHHDQDALPGRAREQAGGAGPRSVPCSPGVAWARRTTAPRRGGLAPGRRSRPRGPRSSRPPAAPARAARPARSPARRSWPAGRRPTSHTQPPRAASSAAFPAAGGRRAGAPRGRSGIAAAASRWWMVV